MSFTPINRGSAPGDGTGDTLYDAFGKVNANEQELYSLLLSDASIVKSVFITNNFPLSVFTISANGSNSPGIAIVNAHYLANQDTFSIIYNSFLLFLFYDGATFTNTYSITREHSSQTDSNYFLEEIEYGNGIWNPTTNYTAGDTVLPSIESDFCLVCNRSGTSGTVEPDWTGNTVLDNTCQWVKSIRKSLVFNSTTVTGTDIVLNIQVNRVGSLISSATAVRCSCKVFSNISNITVS